MLRILTWSNNPGFSGWVQCDQNDAYEGKSQDQRKCERQKQKVQVRGRLEDIILLALKIEERATSQVVCAVSKSQKIQGNKCYSRASKRRILGCGNLNSNNRKLKQLLFDFPMTVIKNAERINQRFDWYSNTKWSFIEPYSQVLVGYFDKRVNANRLV